MSAHLSFPIPKNAVPIPLGAAGPDPAMLRELNLEPKPNRSRSASTWHDKPPEVVQTPTSAWLRIVLHRRFVPCVCGPRQKSVLELLSTPALLPRPTQLNPCGSSFLVRHKHRECRLRLPCPRCQRERCDELQGTRSDLAIERWLSRTMCLFDVPCSLTNHFMGSQPTRCGSSTAGPVLAQGAHLPLLGARGAAGDPPRRSVGSLDRAGTGS